MHELKVRLELVIVLGGDGVLGPQQRVIVRERGEENTEEEAGSYRQPGSISHCETRSQSLRKARRGAPTANDHKGRKGPGTPVVLGLCSLVVIDEAGHLGR